MRHVRIARWRRVNVLDALDKSTQYLVRSQSRLVRLTDMGAPKVILDAEKSISRRRERDVRRYLRLSRWGIQTWWAR